MKVLLSDIKEKAKERPEGYTEEVINSGMVDGQYLVIKNSRYNELLNKYNKGERPIQKQCCNKMPPLTKQLSNAAGAAKRIIKNVMTNEPIKATEDQIKQREEICRKCNYCAPNGRCTLCGCFLAWKAKLSTEHCPAQKW